MKLTASLLLAALLAAPGSESRSGLTVKVSNCLIIAIDDIAVPAQDAGVITAINVKENGQFTVEKGTTLAQIEDRDLQVKRRLAEFEVAAMEKMSTAGQLHLTRALTRNVVDRLAMANQRLANQRFIRV